MRSAPGSSDFDVIVVGAGVNGLVCAALLAQAKRRVVVVEAMGRVGGACTTGDVVAGHRVSTFAHLIGPLDASMVKALKLARHGLTFTAKQISTVALSPEGRHIVLDGDLRHTAQSLAAHSPNDAKAWPAFDARMAKIAGQLQRWVQQPPGGPFDQAARGGSLFAARPAARAGTTLDPEFGALLDGSIGELLDVAFETPLLKGAIAFDGIIGNALSPRAQGTALVAALRAALEVEAPDGVVHPQGGAGAFASALQKAAEATGVRTRLNARVTNLIFEGDRIAGVALAGGEAIYAPVVVSSLNAKATLLGLGAERRLPLGLKRQLSGFRADGCVAKVNLALSSLPGFKGLDKRHLKERLVICPSIEHLDRAFAAYEQGTFSPDPALEITIPSTHDATLATAGQHVLSAHVAYVPKTRARGEWDDAARKELIGAVGATLRQYSPDLPDLILGADLYTPVDIERMGGSPGGHWHGGDLSLDQLGPLRPMPGLSRYETPIAGLYLCGGGTHPMGGVTGVNGRIAAEAVIATTGSSA
jgi:phytoene dehydrogenase-like protein